VPLASKALRKVLRNENNQVTVDPASSMVGFFGISWNPVNILDF